MNRLLTVVFTFVVLSACSQKQINNVGKRGVGIEGYDPVSYFEGKPQKGEEMYMTTYDGVKYWFSSQAHLKTFKENPEQYIPQYGGWCAYAMGKDGSKVSVNPETFKIVDGKLYLFYNKFLTNTLNDWNENEDQLKEQADKNWEGIK